MNSDAPKAAAKDQPQVEAKKDTGKAIASNNAKILAVFALISVSLCVLTYMATFKSIEANKIALTIAAIAQIIPQAKTDFDPKRDFLEVKDTQLGQYSPQKAYVIKSDTHKNWVLPLHAPDGYSGSIHLLLGINKSGEILGVRVASHAETPGLGDKIEIKKSAWIQNFDGLSLTNTEHQDWTIKASGGRFDAFTGASITPKAVIRAVHKGLLYYQDHQGELNARLRKQQLGNPS